MSTAYSTLLGLALPVTGELSGTWGDTVNNYITNYVDAAVAGAQTLNSDADVTLTKTTGSALNGTSSQYAILNCTGARTVLRTITAPAASKVYLVINGTTGGYSVKIVGAGPTTGVTIANGKAALIAWNGSDFVTVASNDASVITGILAVANGGTGLSSGTSGGVLYYSASGTLASSAALAANAIVLGGGAGSAPATTTTGTGVVTALGVNTGTSGAFVVNGGALGTPSSGTLTNTTGLPISTGVSGLGTGVATALAVNTGTSGAFVVNGGALGTPSSGTLTNATGLPLSTGVTGTLPVANGGTGQTSYTDGQLLIGNSTGNTLVKATLTQGTGVTITNGSGAITITNASPMTYPGSGIPNSTGSAWGTSYSTTGSGTVLALATSPSFTTPTLGVASATSINKVALTAPATGSTLTIADGKTLTASNSITLAGTDSTTMTFPPASASVGYLNIPVNSQTAAYTTVLGDSGKTILHPASDNNARTFTIDSNANVAYAVGTAITFINLINTVTIAITSDTMYLAGTGATGSRTLAAYGMATAVKVDTTTWIISGNGLT